MLDKEMEKDIEKYVEVFASEILKIPENIVKGPHNVPDVLKALELLWGIKRAALDKVVIGVQIALFFAALIAAFGAIQSGCESKKLRKETTRQINLMVEPTLSVDITKIINPSLQAVDSITKANYGFVEAQDNLGPLTMQDTLLQKQLEYVCIVNNIGPNLADRISMYIYSPEIKGDYNYFSCSHLKQELGRLIDLPEGSSIWFFAFGDSLNRKDAKTIVNDLLAIYGEGANRLLPILNKRNNKPCLYLFYRDNRKQIYCLTKDFVFDVQGSLKFQNEKVYKPQ